MTDRSFRAAAVQTLARLGDLDFNIELVERYTREAVRQGAELIVFPECMNTGYLFDSPEHAAALAEPVDGRFVTAMADLARDHGVYIASGITEWDPAAETVFNSGVMVGRDGGLVAHYHKQFLATHDQNWFAFGTRGCPVVDTDLGRIGLLICFDGRIPEIARSLALQGAEVLVDMANFFAMDQAEMWGPARAYENGVWLVAATKSGHERSIYYPGGSMIVDPRGRVHAMQPYDTHGVVVADVDPAAARDKGYFPGSDRFADRRPEAYAILGAPYAETPVAALPATPVVSAEATCKVAAVQMHVTDGVGVRDVLDMVSHGAKLGIQVMVLPENAFVGDWLVDTEAAQTASADAPAIQAKVSTLCARWGCAVAYSHPTALGSGELVARATLIGGDGQVIGTYDKVHPVGPERDWATPGGGFPVFEVGPARVGLMLGSDGMFPEAARALGVAGADVILWPTALREPAERRLLAVPRAADNRNALVMANRLDCPAPGGSFVVPPTGFAQWDTDAMAPPAMAMGAVMPTFVDLAVCRQKQMIPKVDMFANRLTGTYGPIVGGTEPASAAAAE